MVLAADKVSEVRGERIGHGWRRRSQQDRLHAVGVSLAADVAALAIEGGAKTLGERGDVVAEQEVRLLSDPQSVDVNPRRAAHALQHRPIPGGLQLNIAGVAQKEPLRRLHLLVSEAVKDKLRARHPRVARRGYHRVQCLHVLEPMFCGTRDRYFGMAALDDYADRMSVERCHSVLETNAKLPDH